MPEQLPPEILRLLASHGPVRLTCGEGQSAQAVTCFLAPFEDTLFCFVNPGHPALRQLLNSPSAQIHLSVPSENITLTIQGRAVQGLAVMTNSRRSELLHWVPEEADPRRILSVSFWPEEVSYRKGEELFEGQTPLGRERRESGKLWTEQCFSGLVPAVVFGLICVWLWVAYAGNGEVVWQFYSLLLSSLFMVTLQVGTHLLYKAACFRRVLTGRCLPESSPLLSEGLLSHAACVRSGFLLVGLSAGLAGVLSAMDPLLLPVAATSSLLWVLWPLWGVHLLQKQPEKKEHDGRPRR